MAQLTQTLHTDSTRLLKHSDRFLNCMSFIKLGLLSLFKQVYRGLAFLLLCATPYICIASARYADAWRGYRAYGGEMLLPLYCVSAIIVVFKAGEWVVQNYRRILKTTTREILARYSEGRRIIVENKTR